MKVYTDIENLQLSPCVATIGFFDGVHKGHRFLIDQVKRLADEEGLQTAVITFPIHPRKVMQADYQPQLLSTAEEKIERIGLTAVVDECFMIPFTPQLSLLSAREFMAHILLQKMNVKTLVIGYDHRFGHNRSESFEDYVRYGHELGMRVVRAEACRFADIAVSSSVCRAFVQEGEMDMAARCLGYYYSLEGKVVDGYKVGRTLGFPTANVCPNSPDKLIPARGVYAVKVQVDGKSYKGMLNIGIRPTMNNGEEQSIEVHIIDFDGNIYHESIGLEFVTRLREEKKFRNMTELAAQLRRDRDAVLELHY